MTTSIGKRLQSTRWRRGSSGVALVETLVAILIFTVGVLGLVGMQAAMMRAQGAGKFRADAANLANEVIGLILTDKPNVAKYATATCTSYQPCTDWKNKVEGLLPKGQVAVTADATTGAVSVTLTWTVPDEGNHTYVTSANVLVN